MRVGLFTVRDEDKATVEKSKKRVSKKYSVQVIRDQKGFEGLQERWDEIAGRHGGYAAFLCFDWFRLWTEHFLRGRELFILAVSHGNDILSIAPCVSTSEKMDGVATRKVELMGNVYSPYRYLVLDPHRDPDGVESLSSIIRFMKENRSSWDVIDFNSIPEEKGWFALLQRVVKDSELESRAYTAYGDWYLDDINFSGADYIAALPKKLRTDTAYCRRRLEKMGNVEIKIIRKNASLDAYMDAYYQVYAKSWQKREGVGPTFHRDLARMSVHKGWLRLGLMFFKGDPIAAQFWITCHDTSYILKTVYDQAYRKHSVGKVLTLEMMKYAIDVDQVKEIDYGQGDEAYKRDWTPKRRERRGILVFNDNVKGRYLALVQNRIRPAIRKNESIASVANHLRNLRRRKRSSGTVE